MPKEVCCGLSLELTDGRDWSRDTVRCWSARTAHFVALAGAQSENKTAFDAQMGLAGSALWSSLRISRTLPRCVLTPKILLHAQGEEPPPNAEKRHRNGSSAGHVPVLRNATPRRNATLSCSGVFPSLINTLIPALVGDKPATFYSATTWQFTPHRLLLRPCLRLSF